MLIKYKYSGWFLFCPIYLTEVPEKYGTLEETNKDELPTETSPGITPRFKLEWLLSLAIFVLIHILLPIFKIKSRLFNKNLILNPIWGIKKLKTPIELIS